MHALPRPIPAHHTTLTVYGQLSQPIIYFASCSLQRRCGRTLWPGSESFVPDDPFPSQLVTYCCFGLCEIERIVTHSCSFSTGEALYNNGPCRFGAARCRGDRDQAAGYAACHPTLGCPHIGTGILLAAYVHANFSGRISDRGRWRAVPINSIRGLYLS